MGKCLIGWVLQFIYLKQKKIKNREFQGNYANINGNRKSVGVSCTWYSVGEDRKLDLKSSQVHTYHDVKTYKITIPFPEKQNGKFLLSQQVYEKIKELI